MRRKHNDILDVLKRDQQRLATSLQVLDQLFVAWRAKEIKKIEDEISRKKKIFSKFETLEKTRKDKTERLAKAKEGFDPQALQAQVKEATEEKNDIDETLKTLHQDIKELNLQASQRAKIDHLRRTKAEKEKLYKEK